MSETMVTSWALPMPRGYAVRRPDAECRSLQVEPGIRLRLVGMGPRDAPAVLCLHGWACSVFSWRHLLPALAADGYRVWAVDLPGHGDSSKPEHVSLYTTAAFAHVIRRLIDELEMGTLAMLVAHSMSAPLALRLTREGRARRLSLLAPVGVVPLPMVRLVRALTPDLLTRWLPRLVPGFTPRLVLRLAAGPGNYAKLGASVADEYWAPSADPRFVRALRHLLHEFDWQALPRSTWRSDPVPTSVLLGGSDRLIPAAATRARLAEVAPAANVRVIERCGHVIPEEAPDLVLDAARTLLRNAARA